MEPDEAGSDLQWRYGQVDVSFAVLLAQRTHSGHGARAIGTIQEGLERLGWVHVTPGRPWDPGKD